MSSFFRSRWPCSHQAWPCAPLTALRAIDGPIVLFRGAGTGILVRRRSIKVPAPSLSIATGAQR